jgi:hypothetical protein
MGIAHRHEQWSEMVDLFIQIPPVPAHSEIRFNNEPVSCENLIVGIVLGSVQLSDEDQSLISVESCRYCTACYGVHRKN